MKTKAKARVYRLSNGKTSPTFQLHSKDSEARALIEFDEETGENRSLRYCANQKSYYADKQDKHARLTPILFIDGVLVVQPKDKLLIDFLAIHPDNKNNGGSKFYEQDFAAEARAEMNRMDLEDQARDLARELSSSEGIRVLIEFGDRATEDKTSDEIKRDLRVYARRDPERFMEVAGMPTSTDSAIEDLFFKAVELKVLQVRELTDRDDVMKMYPKEVENGRKMLIRFNAGEDQMKKLEEFFKTKDGQKEFIELEKQVRAAE